MFRSIIFHVLIVVLTQKRTLTFHAVTENNHVLVGHVFQQLHARDWFNCIQACHDEPRCISYNYERSAGANGLCELNGNGAESFCERDKSLLYSKGFVFQQIRESKVSQSANKNCKILGHANLQDGYEKKHIFFYCTVPVDN